MRTALCGSVHEIFMFVVTREPPRWQQTIVQADTGDRLSPTYLVVPKYGVSNKIARSLLFATPVQIGIPLLITSTHERYHGVFHRAPRMWISWLHELVISSFASANFATNWKTHGELLSRNYSYLRGFTPKLSQDRRMI